MLTSSEGYRSIACNSQIHATTNNQLKINQLWKITRFHLTRLRISRICDESKIPNTKTKVMKTAMQQLLERIEATINNDPINDLGVGQAMALKLMKSRIKNEWLEAEKEQIIEAYRMGEIWN